MFAASTIRVPALVREAPIARTVNEALLAAAHHRDRGLTFRAADGRERHLPYDDVRDEALSRARRFLGQGLRKGDRVAFIVPDGEEFVLSFLGALWAGVVPVPVAPPHALGRLDAYLEATARILAAAEPSMLLTCRSLQPLLWSLVGRPPTLRVLVTTQALRDAPSVPLALDAAKPDDVALLQFTSGSTETPRGVIVTHRNIVENCSAVLFDRLGSDPHRDKVLSWLPLFHDMGLMNVLGPIVARMPAVFLPTLSFVEKPERWMDAVHQHRATITFAPNFAYSLLHRRAGDATLRGWDLSCLRVLGCGAEPIHAPSIRAFLDRFAALARLRPGAFLPCYGMAEATLAIAMPEPGAPLLVDRRDGAELVSCGRALPGHEVAILDTRGERVADGELGEIACRGPSVTAGYFGAPAATRELLQRGWLHTGDLGYSKGGELYVCGRLKDMIIVNGRNHDPQSVEWSAEEVSGVRKGNVVAFSRPAAATEELVVVAESRSPHDLLRAEIARRVRERTTLTVSDVVLLAPGTLPKTTSGKLQRRRTRELYLAGELARQGTRLAGAPSPRLTVAKHVLRSFWRWLVVSLGLLRRAHAPSGGSTDGGAAASALLALVATVARPDRRAAIRLDASLQLDLGLSSLGLLELLAAVEKRFGITVPDGEPGRWHKVSDILDAVQAGGGAPPSSPRPRPAGFLGRAVLALCGWLVRVLFRLEVRGADRLPAGPLLLCPNHESHLDVLFVAAALPAALRRRLVCFAKREHFASAGTRLAARLVGAIPVDRSGDPRPALRAGGEALRAGHALLIHPEGTRTRTGVLGPFRPGAALLALEGAVPLVPINIRGAFAILPPSRALPRLLEWRRLRRLRLEVRFGEPIPPATIAARDLYAGAAALTDRLRDAVSAL
jgi:fatty-acyl-CoA synthase